MSWAGWSREYNKGGPGSLFFLNENGELEASPDFWAYRVYLRDNKGRYRSPSRVARGRQKPISMSEEDRENREMGVGEQIFDDAGLVFDGVREMDGLDGVYENEDPDLYDDLLYDESIKEMDDGDLFDNVFGGGNFADADRGDVYILDKDGNVIVSNAPYRGISVIGASHPRYNIFGTNDVERLVLESGGPRMYDAIARLNAAGRKAWEGSDTPVDHILMKSLLGEGSSLLAKALTDNDRDRLSGARTWRELKEALNAIDLENAKRGIGGYEALAMSGKKPTEEQKDAYRLAKNAKFATEELYPANRIEGAIIKDGAPFGVPGSDFSNMMYDKVAEALLRSLDRFANREGKFIRRNKKTGRIYWKSGPDDIRLVQVAVPLRTVFRGKEVDNLYDVDDIRAGKVHARRSDMNEYVAHSVRPFKDIGSAETFLDANWEYNPFRLYWLDRLKGIPASEAWKNRMYYFGDMETLISDEELKDTKRLAREACEPLLRQCMIVNGITRGYGA